MCVILVCVCCMSVVLPMCVCRAGVCEHKSSQVLVVRLPCRKEHACVCVKTVGGSCYCLHSCCVLFSSNSSHSHLMVVWIQCKGIAGLVGMSHVGCSCLRASSQASDYVCACQHDQQCACCVQCEAVCANTCRLTSPKAPTLVDGGSHHPGG
jgi:hypothetical protein